MASSTWLTKHKVKILAIARKLPEACACSHQECIKVGEIQSGSWNRVASVSLKCRLPNKLEKQFIFRTPAAEERSMHWNVAALQYANRTGIPVPRIVKFDTTNENAFGAPFMIQTRLRGGSAKEHLRQLTQDQRGRLATGLGNVVRMMIETRSKVAGKMWRSEKDNSPNTTPIIQRPPVGHPPRYTEDQDVATMSSNPVANESTCAMLQRVFKAKQQLALDSKCFDKHEASQWAELQTMAKQLDSHGKLEGGFCLCHGDFSPHNIIINPQVCPFTRVLSGVVDWDAAVLAPTVMACQPPRFVWDSDADDSDNSRADEEPEDSRGRELKNLFEEAAGSTYMRWAYGRTNRVARALCRYAILGSPSWDRGLVGTHSSPGSPGGGIEGLLSGWGQIRKTLGCTCRSN